MKVCTLIASGPSAQNIHDNPQLVRGSIAVVNYAGVIWDKIDYWFTLHADFFPAWIEHRLTTGKSMDGIRCICPQQRNRPKGIEFIPRHWPRLGSSSMYAVEMLETMGYEVCHMYGVDLKDPGYKHFALYWPAPEDMKIKIIGRTF